MCMPLNVSIEHIDDMTVKNNRNANELAWAIENDYILIS